jgi:hypothetical protein
VPVPDGDRDVTILERGRGRRTAAEYMASSSEELGMPARIREFEAGGLRGFNLEAPLRPEEGDNTCG